MSASKITDKWMKKFSLNFLENFGHETRNNMEHVRDLVVNPSNPRLIFLFSGSAFINNISENG